jgi:hypothetical protein
MKPWLGDTIDFWLAGVAQLVEHLICNQRVGGSIPSASSIVLNVLASLDLLLLYAAFRPAYYRYRIRPFRIPVSYASASNARKCSGSAASNTPYYSACGEPCRMLFSGIVAM